MMRSCLWAFVLIYHVSLWSAEDAPKDQAALEHCEWKVSYKKRDKEERCQLLIEKDIVEKHEQPADNFAFLAAIVRGLSEAREQRKAFLRQTLMTIPEN